MKWLPRMTTVRYFEVFGPKLTFLSEKTRMLWSYESRNVLSCDRMNPQSFLPFGFSFQLSLELNQQLLDVYFLPHDIQRLEAYSRNQVEYRLILDLTTDICLLYFQGKMNDTPIDSLQKVILI